MCKWQVDFYLNEEKKLHDPSFTMACIEYACSVRMKNDSQIKVHGIFPMLFCCPADLDLAGQTC